MLSNTKSIQYKGKNIRFRETGKGNALVLLHGFTESLEIWNHFNALLSKQYRVICIDLPGHGQSDCLSENHSMEEMATVVSFILQQCNIKKSVLIGHSMGGYVALAFAELYPDLLIGIGLFHSTAYADSDEKKTDRTRTIEIVKKSKMSYISEFIPKLFAPHNLKPLKQEIETVKKASKETSVEGIIGALAGMRDRIDRTGILKQISIPVLFILGKNDVVLPIDKTIALITLPKCSKTLILENTGHMGFIESTKETLFSVEKFTEFCYT